MINYFIAIIFGVVQGITEFLPVSSSGHLVILHNLFDLPISNDLLFDVILHLASLLAVFYFFRKYIWEMLIAWVRSFKSEKTEQSKIAWFIIWATFPAAVFGFLFEDFIEEKFHSVIVVIVMLILVAFLFLLVEKKVLPKKDLEKMNFKDAMFIGFAQVLALIPGTSRSGITIIAGLVKKFKREEAIRFSFLLSIPIVLGANIKKIPMLFTIDFSFIEIKIILISFLACFISAIMTIKFFIKYSQKNSFKIFAFYRIFLALLLIFIFLL